MLCFHIYNSRMPMKNNRNSCSSNKQLQMNMMIKSSSHFYCLCKPLFFFLAGGEGGAVRGIIYVCKVRFFNRYLLLISIIIFILNNCSLPVIAKTYFKESDNYDYCKGPIYI